MNNAILRILEISYKHKLSHIGSCVTTAPIFDLIFQTKSPNEPVILSNGHAGLAYYVYLEKYFDMDAEELLAKRSLHVTRDPSKVFDPVWATTGSLGHGLPIALGYALADKTRMVHCITSDGEWAEGSMWEALEIMAENMVNNLRIYVNANGYGAYRKIDGLELEHKIMRHLPISLQGNVNVFITSGMMPIHNDQSAHYFKMTKEEYETAVRHFS